MRAHDKINIKKILLEKINSVEVWSDMMIIKIKTIELTRYLKKYIIITLLTYCQDALYDLMIIRENVFKRK